MVLVVLHRHMRKWGSACQGISSKVVSNMRYCQESGYPDGHDVLSCPRWQLGKAMHGCRTSLVTLLVTLCWLQLAWLML
jgi:hypothetical protein